MPYLLVERYTFFKHDEEIKIEKTDENNFKMSYYGKTPKLYNLNFKDVLISPGDTIDLIYNRTNIDPANPRDTIVAKGKHSGNYVFSNFIVAMKPASSYPDHNQSKYQNNFPLLFKILDENNKKDIQLLSITLEKYSDNKDLNEYLKRKTRLNLFYDLLYYKDKFRNNLSQQKAVEKVIDSVFLHTTYVKSDTTFAYFMEIAFKNYFDKILIPRFNNLKFGTDVSALVKYIAAYPNPFISTYFVYFLATDRRDIIAKYPSDELDMLIKENPHIGKDRNQILNREHIYK
ncbi:MAG: hypothetical protein EOO91_02105 [Pedobacter sp.]|nr:MAG: hypothetical protein EOO91_02105 [Pedobacter sp.]